MSLPVHSNTEEPEQGSQHASVWDTLMEPFGEIEPFFRRLGRLRDIAPARMGGGWSPLAEHEETDEAYVVRVELPGVPPERVNVEVDGHELAVSGEIEQEHRGEGMLARRVGRFMHRTTLPAAADAENITARLSDGVLTVRAPKVESGGRRSIPVSGGIESAEPAQSPESEGPEESGASTEPGDTAESAESEL